MSDNGATVIIPRSRVSPGTTLNGIYRIDHPIAAGGMGEIYKGYAIQTGDAVAIKMIRSDLAENESALALFRKEASSLHNLQHEAIVRYYLFSIDPQLGRAYLAMEFVDGTSLKDHLVRGPLSFEDTQVLQQRIASGLHSAHKLGIIHRDVAPDNVILPAADVALAKILDFGIARSTKAGEQTIIGSGFAGKYNYVSPEQLGLFGGDVTPKSDIYSLGLVLAECLLGRPIDMNGSQVEVIDKRRVVPDLSKIDPRFRPLLEKMLQPLPENRPATMADVAAWLPPVGKTMRGRKPVGATDESKGGSKTGMAIAAGVGALALLGGGLFFGTDLFRGSGTQVANSGVSRLANEEVLAAEAARRAAEQARVSEEQRISQERIAQERAAGEKLAQERQAEEARRVAETKAAEDARKAAEAKAAEDARRIAEANAAEEARKVAEARAAEEARRVAEAKAAEDVRKAAEARAAEEARRVAEAKAAEDARKAAEAKAAEDRRIAAEARAIEDARKLAEAKTAEEIRRVNEAKAAEDRRLAAEAKAADDARKAADARAAEEARKLAEAKAAEERRLAAEAKAAEDARKIAEAKAAEEARRLALAKAAEERRVAAEAKAADDARRAAEAKAAEDARKLAEAKAAEERRVAAEAKAAEDARKLAEAKAEEEARRQAQQAKIAEERRLAAEAKAAEDARKVAEAKSADEARRQAQAKLVEDRRLATEAKAAEDARKIAETKAAEDARKRAETQAEDARKFAEAQRAEQEAQRLAAAKAEEDAKRTIDNATAGTLAKAEDAQVTERQRLALEQAQARWLTEEAEAMRRAGVVPQRALPEAGTSGQDSGTQVAAVDPSLLSPPRTSDPLVPIRPVPTDPKELTRETQAELQRLGCYTGLLSGNLNNGTREALRTYRQRVKLVPEEASISPNQLLDLRERPNALCAPPKTAPEKPAIVRRPQREEPVRRAAQPRPAPQREAVTRPARPAPAAPAAAAAPAAPRRVSPSIGLGF